RNLTDTHTHTITRHITHQTRPTVTLIILHVRIQRVPGGSDIPRLDTRTTQSQDHSLLQTRILTRRCSRRLGTGLHPEKNPRLIRHPSRLTGSRHNYRRRIRHPHLLRCLGAKHQWKQERSRNRQRPEKESPPHSHTPPLRNSHRIRHCLRHQLAPFNRPLHPHATAPTNCGAATHTPPHPPQRRRHNSPDLHTTARKEHKTSRKDSVVRPPSPATRNPSPVTRNPLPLTRYPSPVARPRRLS